MTYAGFKAHPAAELFPLIEGEEFASLVESIRARGLRNPGTTIVDAAGEVLLLDGRNRARACEAAGVEFRTVPFSGGDPLKFVLDENLERRHLNETQRGMIAASLATGTWGGSRSKGKILPLTLAEAGQMCKVSREVVKQGRKVFTATPELVAAATAGGIAISAAAEVASLPDDEQKTLVKQGRKAVAQKARKIKRERARKKKEKALAEIAKGNRELGKIGPYPVVYADPPWEYRKGTVDPTRSLENHYPTMPLKDICALGVQDIVTDDAVLFLWATAPLLPEALKVMESWGFGYKSQMVWDKENIGLGFWFRGQHEILLLGVRGKPPAPAPSSLVPSVFREKRTEHSRKPAFFAEMIDAYYPDLPKVELFCRDPRDGWETWGNQS